MRAAIVQISGNTEVVSPPLIIAILSPLLYILVFLGSRELYNLVLISWGKDGQRLVWSETEGVNKLLFNSDELEEVHACAQ